MDNTIARHQQQVLPAPTVDSNVSSNEENAKQSTFIRDGVSLSEKSKTSTISGLETEMELPSQDDSFGKPTEKEVIVISSLADSEDVYAAESCDSGSPDANKMITNEQAVRIDGKSEVLQGCVLTNEMRLLLSNRKPAPWSNAYYLGWLDLILYGIGSLESFQREMTYANYKDLQSLRWNFPVQCLNLPGVRERLNQIQEMINEKWRIREKSRLGLDLGEDLLNFGYARTDKSAEGDEIVQSDVRPQQDATKSLDTLVVSKGPVSVPTAAEFTPDPRWADTPAEHVSYFVSLLSRSRACNDQTWTNILKALKNSAPDDRYLEDAHKFSSLRENYKKEDVDVKWNGLERKTKGHNIGTIMNAAKADNPEAYAEFQKKLKGEPDSTKPTKERTKKQSTNTATPLPPLDDDDLLDLLERDGEQGLALVIARVVEQEVITKASEHGGFIWDEETALYKHWEESGALATIICAMAKPVIQRYVLTRLDLLQDESSNHFDPKRARKLEKIWECFTGLCSSSKLANRVIGIVKIRDSREDFRRSENMDKIPYLFPVGDKKVVDLRPPIRLLPRTREHLFTMTSRIPYEPGFKHPDFNDVFLNGISLGDRDFLTTLQLLMSYFLTGENKKRIFTFLTGIGLNGKSVLLKLLRKVMGGFATEGRDHLLFKSKAGVNSGPDPSFLEMSNKRVITFTETAEDAEINETFLLKLAGDDPFTSRNLNDRHNTEIHSSAKAIIISNHTPKFSNNQAIFDRLVAMLFKARFVSNPKPDTNERSIDPTLKERLMSDDCLKAFLAWAIEGNYYSNENFEIPPQFRDVAREIQDECDPLGVYIRGHIIPEKDARLQTSDLRASFEEWYTQRNEEAPSEREIRQLYARVKKLYGNSTPSNGTRYYKGCRLITPPPPTTLTTDVATNRSSQNALNQINAFI